MSIHCYILAGGKSSRMGEEKGLVLFKNKPLIQHVIDVVVPLSYPIFIVSSNKCYDSFGFPLISDIEPGLGPAGAIHSVLQHSTATKNIVLACDMPFLDLASIQLLVRESENVDITLPIYNKFPESLFAIYDTQCKMKWNDLIRKGVLKLSDFFPHFDTKFVDGNKMCEANKHLFVNMNSKEDLINER